MFDRLIFRGHLRRLHVAGGMRAFLWSQGVPLTRFGPYVQRITRELVEHAEGRYRIPAREGIRSAAGRVEPM